MPIIGGLPAQPEPVGTLAAVSLLRVGPITAAPYNFNISRSSPSNAKGFRTITFSGDVDSDVADQLDELVVNPDARRSVGGQTGVQEYVESTSPALVSVNGYCLLTGFDATLSIDPNWPFASFSLTAILMGDLL